jgi:hypothetical protein
MAAKTRLLRNTLRRPAAVRLSLLRAALFGPALLGVAGCVTTLEVPPSPPGAAYLEPSCRESGVEASECVRGSRRSGDSDPEWVPELLLYAGRRHEDADELVLRLRAGLSEVWSAGVEVRRFDPGRESEALEQARGRRVVVLRAQRVVRGDDGSAGWFVAFLASAGLVPYRDTDDWLWSTEALDRDGRRVAAFPTHLRATTTGSILLAPVAPFFWGWQALRGGVDDRFLDAYPELLRWHLAYATTPACRRDRLTRDPR